MPIQFSEAKSFESFCRVNLRCRPVDLHAKGCDGKCGPIFCANRPLCPDLGDALAAYQDARAEYYAERGQRIASTTAKRKGAPPATAYRARIERLEKQVEALQRAVDDHAARFARLDDWAATQPAPVARARGR